MTKYKRRSQAEWQGIIQRQKAGCLTPYSGPLENEADREKSTLKRRSTTVKYCDDLALK